MIRLIVCACAFAVSAQASIVLTDSGPVRGKLVEEDGVSYYAYLGIPYAENPTGQLRFKPPVPKRPWLKILDATQSGPACPQPTGEVTRDEMGEDCLRLNIFVPANKISLLRLLPVFVYVHGGNFKSGSGNIDKRNGPQLLLEKGIIYVSMNFRLGPLGYLSLETDEASGNAGLKDLLLALKWIKRNILKFGGGPITLGGQSSGSGMVHHMLLTEKSSGLFKRAIMLSGSATSHRFIARYPRYHALALAAELGLQEDNDNNTLSNLRKANVFDLIDAQDNLYKNERNIMRPGFAPFLPVIEKESKHSILTKDPIDIVKEGIPQNVPLFAGYTSQEAGYMWPSLHVKTDEFLQEKMPLSIPNDIEYPMDSDMYKGLVASISDFYFGNTNSTLDNLINLLSDTQYAYWVESWINIHKSHKGSAKLYCYMFNFDGELNWAKATYNISYPGAVHADDLGYFFINQVTKDKMKNLDKKSQQTLENMLTFVSNFVKYGEPTPVSHSATGGIVWEERGSEGRILFINDQPTSATSGPYDDRFHFWDNVYKQYNEYLQNGGERETRVPPP